MFGNFFHHNSAEEVVITFFFVHQVEEQAQVPE